MLEVAFICKELCIITGCFTLFICLGPMQYSLGMLSKTSVLTITLVPGWVSRYVLIAMLCGIGMTELFECSVNKCMGAASSDLPNYGRASM